MARIFITTVFILLTMVVQAQVPVRDEPRHHNVFENEFVRILDVNIPPGDTTQFHLHQTPSVFTFLTTSATGSELQSRAVAETTSLARTVQYDSLVKPRVHRVWNKDMNWFHVLDIELVAAKPSAHPATLKEPGLALLFDKPLVNGYRWKILSPGKLDLPSAKNGYLLISFDDAHLSCKIKGVIDFRKMKAGHYVWIEGESGAAITVDDAAGGEFLLLQLK
jgi:hypothetical protein